MEINITNEQQNELQAIYAQLNSEQQTLLVNIFGEDTFKPKDIRDRVKTFEDACTVLGIDPDEWKKKHLMFDKDVLAYLKLRVITQALNEGWYPKFTEDERRYYPWFYILTQEEYDNLSAEEKRRCVGRALSSASASGGLVSAVAYYASSSSFTSYGARLAFSNYDLAVYAGKQFIDIWADFVLEIRDENSNTQQSLVDDSHSSTSSSKCDRHKRTSTHPRGRTGRQSASLFGMRPYSLKSVSMQRLHAATHGLRKILNQIFSINKPIQNENS